MSFGGYEYGGGGGFGGYGGFGGFDGGGGGFGMENDGGFVANGSKSAEKKSRDHQTLLPVTVKQLMSSKTADGNFKIDEIELNTVKLVGTINDPQNHTTNCTFQLDDGTGVIECKQWIDKENGVPSAIQNLTSGAIVRIFGTPREYNGSIHVMLYKAQPVTQFDEVAYHTLDVILTHLQNTRGLPPSAQTQQVPATGGFSTPGSAGFNSYLGNNAANNLNQGFKQEQRQQNQSDLYKQIFDVYRQCDRTEGLSYQEVQHALRVKGVNISLDELVRGVIFLNDQGHVFSTTDDQHYATTGSEYY